MPDLPADLPTNWTQGQIISPNGTEVGLTEQHGYNYLMEQVNAAQTAINAAQGAIDSINQALESVAQESTLQGVATDVEEISGLIGTTTDTGGSTTAGSVMGKLNQLVGSAGLSGFQEFDTPGAFSFTVPAGVTLISITACGGGGGGCASSNIACGCGGGGGAAVLGMKRTVTPGQVISGTVGAGGQGSDGRSNAANGGDTVITGVITLAGGEGASYERKPGRAGGYGGGMGGTVGYVFVDRNSESRTFIPPSAGEPGILGLGGSPGNMGAVDENQNYYAAGGGGGSLGCGGRGDFNQEDQTSPLRNGEKGGGGGGGYRATTSSSARVKAGKGGDGYVKFSWGVCMD